MLKLLKGLSVPHAIVIAGIIIGGSLGWSITRAATSAPYNLVMIGGGEAGAWKLNTVTGNATFCVPKRDNTALRFVLDCDYQLAAPKPVASTTVQHPMSDAEFQRLMSIMAEKYPVPQQPPEQGPETAPSEGR